MQTRIHTHTYARHYVARQLQKVQHTYVGNISGCLHRCACVCACVGVQRQELLSLQLLLLLLHFIIIVVFSPLPVLFLFLSTGSEAS